MKNIEDLVSSNRISFGTDTRTLRQTFVVNLKHGMHARPCAQVVKTLRSFRSRVQVEANGTQANGHSIMGLMALAAGPESRLTFTITGHDAPQAMTAVGELFAQNFSEPVFSAAV